MIKPSHTPPFSVLFPAFCHGLREADPEFQREVNALERLGIPWRVVNTNALTAGDTENALKYFGDAPAETMIYRGWILRPAEYALLFQSLRERGGQLLTSPAAYRSALLFPEFYPAIADRSIPATWIRGDDPAVALEAARVLGDPPYFIKDYIKSAKENWPTGCVVRSNRSLHKTIRDLRDFRGDQFHGGIVIRPLIPLRYLGQCPFGRNVHEEYRLIFFRGTMIASSPYDRVAAPSATPLDDYRFLASRIASPFFTADIVVTEDGEQYILEIGDGGTSGLPPTVDAVALYAAMLNTYIQSEPQQCS